MRKGFPGRGRAMRLPANGNLSASRYYSWMRDRQTFRMVALAALVGLLAGGAGVLLRRLVAAFQDLFFVDGARLLSFLGSYYVIPLPAAGGLVVGLMVVYLAKEVRGAGVSDVVHAVIFRGSRMRLRMAGVKVAATSLVIGSGGSAGIEGPIIQIGSALGSGIGQRLRLSGEELRITLAAGAAAGIAATFNTPLAGVFFALEVILVDFSSSSFGMVVIAAVLANVVSRMALGGAPIFPVPQHPAINPAELVFYLGLGGVAALVGVAFTFGLDRVEGAFARWSIPDYLKPAVGGLMVGAIGFFFPQVFGLGYGTVGAALREELPLVLMAGLVVVKLLATCITVGSGSSGGVIGPSLYLGAVTGGTFGALLHGFLPGFVSGSGPYALVGMAAVFSATAHAPITAIFTLFELTNDYNLILPLMIACVVSGYLAHQVTPHTIYSVRLGHRGVDIRAGRTSLPLLPGTTFVDLEVVPGSRASGKRVREIDLPPECVLVSVRRTNRALIPRGDTLLLPGDRVLAVCRPDSTPLLRRLVDSRPEESAPSDREGDL